MDHNRYDHLDPDRPAIRRTLQGKITRTPAGCFADPEEVAGRSISRVAGVGLHDRRRPHSGWWIFYPLGARGAVGRNEAAHCAPLRRAINPRSGRVLMRGCLDQFKLTPYRRRTLSATMPRLSCSLIDFISFSMNSRECGHGESVWG